MSLIKRNGELFPAIPSLFDDFFNRDFFDWGNNNYSATNTTVPAINIKEGNDSFEVEMAAPGMQKQDFHISLDGNTLTIASEKKHEENREDEKYTRREFSYQSFRRNFTLPKDVVDEDGIVAKYENGVLRLTIPKKEHAKQKMPRLIEIG